MNNSIIQLHSLTPDELKNVIQDIIQNQLDEIKLIFQPKEPVEYLTRQQTAELLQIDLSTLWKWTKKGKIPSYSIASRVYYKRTDVENALVKTIY